MKKLFTLALLFNVICFRLCTAVAECSYEDASSTVFTTIDGLSHNQVQGFCQDRRGLIWVCTWYGLDAFGGYELLCFRPHDGLSLRGRLKQAMLTDDDRILLKTTQSQTWQFSLHDYTFTLLEDSALWDGTVLRRRFQDRVGNLWQKETLGFRFTPPKPDHYQYLDNVNYPLARVICEDAHHHVLIAWDSPTSKGNAEGMLIRYDLNGQPMDTLYKGNAVCALFEDEHRNIWLGTHNDGLILLTPDDRDCESPHYRTTTYQLPSAVPIFALAPDTQGRIWVGTLGDGVYLASWDARLHQLTLMRPQDYPLEEYACVRSILEADDSMLIATDGGLLQVSLATLPNRMVFRPVCASQGFSELIHLLRTSEGRILVSAFGRGIYQYVAQQDTLIPYAATDIAAHQAVYSMADNPDGTLWVTTQTSLRLYRHEHDYSCPVSELLDMIETTPLRDSQGHCWFATQRGVIRLTSLVPARGNSSPTPIFVSMQFHEAKQGGLRLLTLADSLVTLHPDERNVTIGVSALQYGALERVHYAWRLSEVDTAWHVSPSHWITLPRLAPGNYTLQLCASDGGNVPHQAVSTLRLCVEYKWYETWFFRSLLGLCIGCVLLTLVVLLLQVKKLRRLVLDSQPVALLSAAITEVKLEENLTGADMQFISQLNELVGNALSDQQLSIERLAADMGMSRSTFYRRLKAVVGQSPNEYISEMRLSRAAELLRSETDASIATIAYECGFSSPQYFSNVFRRRYHMTPNQWRNP